MDIGRLEGSCMFMTSFPGCNLLDLSRSAAGCLLGVSQPQEGPCWMSSAGTWWGGFALGYKKNENLWRSPPPPGRSCYLIGFLHLGQKRGTNPENV